MPRNVLLDQLADRSGSLLSMHGCMCARAGRLACARASSAVRLVFCVLTCCILYRPSPSSLRAPSLDVLSLDVVMSHREPALEGTRTCIPSDMGSRTVSRRVRRVFVPPRPAPNTVWRQLHAVFGAGRSTTSLPKVKRRISRAFSIGCFMEPLASPQRRGPFRGTWSP